MGCDACGECDLKYRDGKEVCTQGWSYDCPLVTARDNMPYLNVLAVVKANLATSIELMEKAQEENSTEWKGENSPDTALDDYIRSIRHTLEDIEYHTTPEIVQEYRDVYQPKE